MKNERSKEEYEEIINLSLSIADVCRKLGIKAVGGNYKTIHDIIKKYNLDTSHFTGKAWNQGIRYKMLKQPKSLDEILVEGSNYQSLKLKNRLLKEGLKEHICENCGRTEWEGNLIPLELHHINGNKFDNRIENLQLLCPNCHTLTDNYRGKNNHRYIPPQRGTTIQIVTENDIVENIKKPKKQKIKEKAICLTCGNEFEKNDKNQKYCCLECYKNANRETKRPNFKQFVNDIKELPNFVQLGKKYGVSDKAIAKWCKHYDLPTHIKELTLYIKDII